MEHVARKFSKAKWEVMPFMEGNDIVADAITVCLRTFDNKLSFWQCSLERGSLEEVVLALATGPNSRLEKLHLMALSKEELQAQGLVFSESEGNTVVNDLRNRHIDLIELTLDKLSKVARLMASQIRKNTNCIHLTRKNVREIINRAISNHRLSKEGLPDNIRQEL
jgi:hypothetical protein